MTDGPVSGAHALLERTEALLQKLNADFQRTEDGEVLLMIGDANSGRCEGMMVVEERITEAEITGAPQTLLLCHTGFLLPLEPVPQERRAATHELLAMLAPEVDLGSFEIDTDSAELRFRIQQLFAVGPVVLDATLLAMLFESLNAIDRHLPQFTQVMAGVEPPHALARFLMEDPERSGDPEVQEQCFRLLRLATQRYKEQQEPELQEQARQELARLGQ